MSRKKDIDLDLTGFAELFMNDEGRAESRLPRIYDIPLSEIDDFPNHPFKVKMDEDMNQLVQSVKERGVITPITLRQKEDGRYEIVSGHRRRKACELAGLDSVPAEIKELSRDEAIILMVESNLQRSIILPSEKAFSYKMRLEAMKRQGQRTDLTSGPVVQKFSRDALGDKAEESGRQISRYIRLTELIPELLDMVDENKIAFRPAVELSYLTETEQHNLLNSISYNDATPSLPQAIRLKEFSKAGKLSAEVIEAILGRKSQTRKRKSASRQNGCVRIFPPLCRWKRPRIISSRRWNIISVQGSGRKGNKQDNLYHGESMPICGTTVPTSLLFHSPSHTLPFSKPSVLLPEK